MNTIESASPSWTRSVLSHDQVIQSTAMPCKRKAQTSTTKVAAEQEIASQKIPRTMYGCKVESHESTRQRVESSLLTKHEDPIAATCFTSVTHDNLVHKFLPMPQDMKIPDAKGAVDCGVENTIEEVLRQSRAQGRHCEGRFWSLCSLH